MPLSPYALYFKQDFSGGYTYLDRCGEFLCRAEAEMEMIVVGDQATNGCHLEQPEFGLKFEFNSNYLRLTSELPIEDSDPNFVEYAEYLSGLYLEMFNPRTIEKNGVAAVYYQAFASPDSADRESLGVDSSGIEDIASVIGMTQLSKTFEYRFEAGTKNLRIKSYPVTFESVQAITKNPLRGSTKRQAVNIERQNSGSKRLLDKGLQYALFVDFDLSEESPPENSIRNLITELLEKRDPTFSRLFSVEK